MAITNKRVSSVKKALEDKQDPIRSEAFGTQPVPDNFEALEPVPLDSEVPPPYPLQTDEITTPAQASDFVKKKVDGQMEEEKIQNDKFGIFSAQKEVEASEKAQTASEQAYRDLGLQIIQEQNLANLRRTAERKAYATGGTIQKRDTAIARDEAAMLGSLKEKQALLQNQIGLEKDIQKEKDPAKILEKQQQIERIQGATKLQESYQAKGIEKSFEASMNEYVERQKFDNDNPKYATLAKELDEQWNSPQFDDKTMLATATAKFGNINTATDYMKKKGYLESDINKQKREYQKDVLGYTEEMLNEFTEPMEKANTQQASVLEQQDSLGASIALSGYVETLNKLDKTETKEVVKAGLRNIINKSSSADTVDMAQTMLDDIIGTEDEVATVPTASAINSLDNAINEGVVAIEGITRDNADYGNDAHVESLLSGFSDEALRAAMSVMDAETPEKLTDLFGKSEPERAKLREANQIMGILRKQARAKDDKLGEIKASAGYSQLLSDQQKSLADATEVIALIDTLEDLLDTKEGDSFMKNVFDAKLNIFSGSAAAIKGTLNAIAPKAARGLFGEVGVLTDADIDRYRVIFPRLTQPKQVRDVMTALSKRIAHRALESRALGLARGKRDVSSYYNQLSGLKQDADVIESEFNNLVGIKKEEERREVTKQEAVEQGIDLSGLLQEEIDTLKKEGLIK